MEGMGNFSELFFWAKKEDCKMTWYKGFYFLFLSIGLLQRFPTVAKDKQIGRAHV